MKTFTPGNKPYAASALILSPNGLVLSVSRKHDPNDLGLPGGKLDPGEDFMGALRREVKEETGYEVLNLQPFFGDYCGTPGVHQVHWCLTFVCQVQGKIETKEKGRVVWIPAGRLIADEQGKLNSFGSYNENMFKAFRVSGIEAREFYSNVEILESQTLRWSWDDSKS